MMNTFPIRKIHFANLLFYISLWKIENQKSYVILLMKKCTKNDLAQMLKFESCSWKKTFPWKKQKVQFLTKTGAPLSARLQKPAFSESHFDLIQMCWSSTSWSPYPYLLPKSVFDSNSGFLIFFEKFSKFSKIRILWEIIIIYDFTIL